MAGEHDAAQRRPHERGDGSIQPEHGGPRPLRAVVDAWVGAYLAACLVLVAETIAVAVLARRQWAGLYEFARAVTALLPVGLAAAAALALGGAVLLLSLGSVHRQRGQLLIGLLAAAFGAAVGVSVSTGRQLAGGRRPWFVGAVVVCCVVLAVLGLPVLQRGLARLRRMGAIALCGAVALWILLLEVLNALVLPRLYPGFHAGLAVLSLWSAAAAAYGWTASPAAPESGPGRRRRATFRRFGALALAASSAVLTPWSARRLGGYDNIRLIYLEGAPILGHGVTLAAVVSPPVPLDRAEVLPTRPIGEGAVDLSARNVLLVTIDALRADHVGAYGYPRRTTPSLDGLAAEGVVFEAAYSPTPHTSYAIASLMTGKHMRPLMRQGVADPDDTWPTMLQRYGYRTAGFFPPAVFYIDRERFGAFEERGLGFEYRKIEFGDPTTRVEQVRAYLDRLDDNQRWFVWVHLFEPHEPYECHEAHDFGDRAIDCYDSEIAAADAGVGALLELVRATHPRTVVVVAADHGEEFGDHGGRYHGTTVYDEQVRVPLIVVAPGAVQPRRVAEPVSLVDLLPTVLRGLQIPVSPRIHGRDLGPLLAGEPVAEGFAFAETDEQELLAVGPHRLICARQIGACRLFDVTTDPKQHRDRSGELPAKSQDLKRRLAGFVSGLGRFGRSGESADGAGRWPSALRRGIAGDGDAAGDVAGLLDDADVRVRRKASEVLFELRRQESAPQLRRTLGREEDPAVRRWCALALTRLGQGAPLTLDLLRGKDLHWSRLAALTLAESGDARGEEILIRWWKEAFPNGERPGQLGRGMSFRRAKEIAEALGTLRSEDAVIPLTRGLADVRLRRYVARALAEIGDDAARPALAKALAQERYHDARVIMASALVELGAGGELRGPLIRFLGVPDPMPNGLGLAQRAGILALIGGPRKKELRRLRSFANSGVSVGLVIPPGGNQRGFRVLIRARTSDDSPGQVRFGVRTGPPPGARDHKGAVPAQVPELDAAHTVTLQVAPGDEREIFETLPPEAAEHLEAGEHANFVVYATQNVVLEACAVVPLADDIPPPPPEPWAPEPRPDHPEPHQAPPD